MTQPTIYTLSPSLMTLGEEMKSIMAIPHYKTGWQDRFGRFVLKILREKPGAPFTASAICRACGFSGAEGDPMSKDFHKRLTILRDGMLIGLWYRDEKRKVGFKDRTTGERLAALVWRYDPSVQTYIDLIDKQGVQMGAARVVEVPAPVLRFDAAERAERDVKFKRSNDLAIELGDPPMPRDEWEKQYDDMMMKIIMGEPLDD